ncbi:MAG TPA: hypothetical protein PK156_17595 [Polyangium sp.]|nr:hypothetical protein [Polyangium sp.]
MNSPGGHEAPPVPPEPAAPAVPPRPPEPPEPPAPPAPPAPEEELDIPVDDELDDEADELSALLDETDTPPMPPAPIGKVVPSAQPTTKLETTAKKRPMCRMGIDCRGGIPELQDIAELVIFGKLVDYFLLPDKKEIASRSQTP